MFGTNTNLTQTFYLKVDRYLKSLSWGQMSEQISAGEGLPLLQYKPAKVAFIKLEEGLENTPGCVCEEADG